MGIPLPPPDDLADFIARDQRVQAAMNFELAAAELRALGITLARLRGEYRVNYRNGRDATARNAGTLDETLRLGRELAANAPAVTRLVQAKRRRRGGRRMTPKTVSRRLRMEHLRRVARAIRQQQKK